LSSTFETIVHVFMAFERKNPIRKFLTFETNPIHVSLIVEKLHWWVSDFWKIPFTLKKPFPVKKFCLRVCYFWKNSIHKCLTLQLKSCSFVFYFWNNRPRVCGIWKKESNSQVSDFRNKSYSRVFDCGKTPLMSLW